MEVTRKMPGADVGGLLRSGVASLCLAAGVLHVSAAADHRGMAGHVAFFLAVAAAQSALGAAVLIAARPARWLTVSALVNLVVAIVWVLSRTSGLPVDGTSAPEALGFKDGISTMIEIGAAAGAGLWWLLPDGARRVALPSGRRAATLLGTGVWAVGAAGLFAGHTHSPGHPHSGDPVRHDDHAPRAAQDAVAAGAGDDGHPHAAAAQGAAHDPADHHRAPEARLAAVGTSVAGVHDHGARHLNGEDPPAPGSTAGHRHEPATAGPAQDHSGHGAAGHGGEAGGHSNDGSAGGDHRHSGDDHDHNHDEGGSGKGRGDEDGGASPLEDVLKLIQPR
jgi:hypothetical protein